MAFFVQEVATSMDTVLPWIFSSGTTFILTIFYKMGKRKKGQTKSCTLDAIYGIRLITDRFN